MARLLKAWGFTSQKPAFRAFEQDPHEVRKWRREQYPRIREMARKQRGVIVWLDEVGLRSQHTSGKSFAPKGHTPVLKKTGKRFYLNEICAFSPQGRLAFMVVEDNFNGEVFLRFLNKLVKGFAKKVFLILDSHPVHLAKAVSDWRYAHQREIAFFFLPGYSPELNPVEYFNQDLKSNVTGRRRPRNITDLKKTVASFSKRKRNNPRQVKQYFQAHDVMYATNPY